MTKKKHDFSRVFLEGKPRVKWLRDIADKKAERNDYAGATHKLTDYRVYVDSGAHTLYNSHIRDAGGYNKIQGTGQDTFAFYDSQEFKTYLEDYIAFLHLHKDQLEFYVTLDVIKNPKRTWDVLKYMESCGLSPMPVYHYGEDIYWYKKMIDNYEYVGIGGLGQEITKSSFFPFADKLFAMIKGEDGKPRIKTHGFAITALEVLTRYPWHTTDSSTWTTLSRSGSISVPKMTREGKYDFLHTPGTVAFTEQRKGSSVHFNNQTPSARRHIEEYIESLGLTPKQIATSFHHRDVANIKFFLNVEKEVKVLLGEQFNYAEGGNILFAGTPAGSSSNLSKFVRLLTDVDTKSIGWLGTIYYPLILNNLLEIKRTLNSGHSPLQKQMHKPNKIPGLTNVKTPSEVVPAQAKTLKVKVEVKFEYEYVLNAAAYKCKSDAVIQHKEETLVKKEFSQITHAPTHFSVEINPNKASDDNS